MGITIRRGIAADAPAAAELWLRARAAATGAIPPAVHTDDEVRTWFGTHVVGSTELWVAEGPPGTLAGVLVLDGDFVDQLYVEPLRTGGGIGAELIALAKRRRPEGLSLWTFVSNTRAQSFYERHGFIEIRRTDGAGNEERAPDILFRWRPDH